MSELKTTQCRKCSMETPSFLKQKPPPGYVAGVGRGAVGFTTRTKKDKTKVPSRITTGSNGGHSDLVKQHSHGTKDIVNLRQRHDLSGEAYNDETSNNVEKEDEDEKRIFEQIELRLQNKRIRDAKTDQTTGSENLDLISAKFVDLKRNLAVLSEADWLSLPDASDITRRNKRVRAEEQLHRKTFAAPDALLQPNVDLSKLTEEREKLLAVHLDKTFGESSHRHVATDTSADQSIEGNVLTTLEVEDIKKNRAILAAYRKSHPRNAENWIASARIEEKANHFNKAKSLISEGCRLCPRNEDVWMESIRLHSSDKAYCKILVSTAIRLNETSEKLWLKAIDLEDLQSAKIRVVRKALLKLPYSEGLWKLAFTLESSESEKVKILTKAVELIPKSSDLWLALVQLQPLELARISLEKAEPFLRNSIPFWIAKCQIIEDDSNESSQSLLDTINEGIQHIQSVNGSLEVSSWFAEAMRLSDSGKHLTTAKAIIHMVLNVLPVERINNVDDFLQILSPHLQLQITVYSSLVSRFPKKYSWWKSFIRFSVLHSMTDVLYTTFDDLLFGYNDENVKRYPVLALMYAKLLWNWGENCVTSLSILDKALRVHPSFMEFWHAKLKVLNKIGRVQDITQCYNDACDKVSDDIQSLALFYVKCLQYHGCFDAAKLMVKEGLDKYRNGSQWYVLAAEIGEQQKDVESAKIILTEACEALNHDPTICITLANLETKAQNWNKARSILSISLLRHPTSDILYDSLIELEHHAKDEKQVRYLVTQGLKVCSNSWRLWSQNIRTLPKRSMRKTIFQDALTATNEHPMVITEIGKIYLHESLYTKAHKWFLRATEKAQQFGDPWVWLYLCELRLKSSDSSKAIEYIEKEVNEDEPRLGPLWEASMNSYEHVSDSPVAILHDIVRKVKNSGLSHSNH